MYAKPTKQEKRYLFFKGILYPFVFYIENLIKMQIPLVKGKIFLFIQVGLATWSLRFLCVAPVTHFLIYTQKSGGTK